MKKATRCLAITLVLCMLSSLLPVRSYAAEGTEDSTDITAMEIPGASRLDDSFGFQEKEETSDAVETPAYDEDEMVTVIVMMDDLAVMDYFGMSTYRSQDSDLTAGEAVAEFLASEDAQAFSQELLMEQQSVFNEIRAVTEDASPQDDTKVVAQWTGLVNAMAVQIPYGRLQEVKELDGVANAYVQREFAAPEPPTTDAGTAGYSYDLVGLNQVWAEKYFGQGMLVSVLDTGLDLEWASWGDSSDPQTGIRRVHEAFTENSFKTEEGKQNVRYTESAMEAFLEKTKLNANTDIEGNLLIFDHNALYKNRKVPFSFDYADWDVNVRPEDADHGTHVAGTMAGYAETTEGEVIFSGVAPDAQILAMKVFDDNGASAAEIAILSALEDSAALGADVINLSLGSDNGFSVENTAPYFAYERLRQSGVLFMISAGNSAYSSAYNNRGDYNLSSDPETSMMSTPSSYDSSLSIASMDNVIGVESHLTWTDIDGTKTSITYADPWEIAMKSMFVGEEVAIIPVDGYGTYDDYYNAGFRGYYGYGEKGVSGIALVKRGGGLSFEEKINQATRFTWSYYNPAVGYYVTEYPVKAVIIYDEDPNATELIYMSVDGALLTSCFISGKDGAALYEAAKAAVAEGKQVTLTAQKDDVIVDNVTAGQMSSFTSWGATPGLELKPDITAPGGNIWSSVPDYSFDPANPGGVYDDYIGEYGMMSGTSMAAPHMTGITALVKQYVKASLGLSGVQAANLTEMLLVSTATPLSYNGVQYSPRVQGAGMVDADDAINTPAYISVEGQKVGKIELLDDPDKTGVYTMSFQVNNLTDRELTYQAAATVMRPDTMTENGKTYMLDNNVLLQTMDLGAVMVPANGSTSVQVTVALTDAEKNDIEELFPNGTYVEGFVTLTSDADPQIGLPYMGFYGDWTKAPIFDSETWLTDEFVPATDTEDAYWAGDTTWGTSIMGYFDGYAFYNLGQNPFDPVAYTTQSKYLEENIALSPTGLFRSVNDVILYQLRDSKLIVVEVKDKTTGELYYRDFAPYLTKTVFNYTYGVPIPMTAYYFTDTYWEGTDLDGKVLPSGTQCVYTITAYGDGDYEKVLEDGYLLEDFAYVIPGDPDNEPTFNERLMDKTGDVISFDIEVDTIAPKLVNSAVTTYVENGRTYLTGTFKDDGSIASVEIYPQVKRTYNLDNNPYGDPDYYEYGVDNNNPFYSEMIYDADTREWTFKVDVTEYEHIHESYEGENYYYNYEWTGNVFIYGGDYGGNDRAYGVTVTTGDGLILSTTSAKLYVGDSFDLNVIDNTGSEDTLTRTSTNPDVATVDEFGHVVAVTPGQTEIVISNGTDEVVCIVAVLEKKTEVVDFSLSLDRFDGLKPDGSVAVRIVDLEPADVIITENIWMVYEDDEEWAGLLNVSKNTSDGMEGSISLNASMDDSEVPSAGTGYLEVTLNGVTRRMEISWDELYDSQDADGLISGAYYNDQTVYVEMGETADLLAKYRQNHSFIDVALYTLVGYQSYGYDNPLTLSTGLTLDGPGFVANGKTWIGKLVAEPGYELPEEIKVVTRYDYGYESEMYPDAAYSGYTYNSETGEIVVKEAPYGATNTLIIRADGVVCEGAPGGTHSGTEYSKPDGTYGPFDWKVTAGNGELTTGEIADDYETKEAAFYTPGEPGVSYITATSKDGRYSVNFAVVCTGIQAEKMDLAQHNLTLYVGDTYQLEPTLEPIPTLDQDKRLVYTSFNQDVVTVDENGMLKAVAEGYAYIGIEVASGVDLETYCVVQVLPCMSHVYSDWTETTAPGCETPGVETRTCKCGHSETRSVDALGHDMGSWTETAAPTCTENGEEARSCNRDHCDYTETRTVDPLGHSMTGWTETKAPSCTEPGEEVNECIRENCDHKETREMEPTGHTLSDWTVSKELTCTENGEEIRNCSACEYTETRELKAIGHVYDMWSVTKEADCTHTGEKVRACVNCDHKEFATIPEKAHRYEETVTDPTATTRGYTTHTCTRCGHSYTDNFKEAGTRVDTHTGDTAMIGMWIGLALLSLSVAAILRYTEKRRYQ